MVNESVYQRAEALMKKLSSAQDRAETLESLIENEKALLAKAQGQHVDTLTAIEETQLSLETMKKAIVPLTERGLKRLTNLISFGLRTIFHDKKYAVDIEVKERGNDKTADIWLIEDREDGEQVRVRARDSIGGGVKAVIALILRVFFILHYKLRRVIVMDEPFTDVNIHYLPGLFKFLQYTIDDLKFDWLIVTNDPRQLPYGDLTYKVYNGDVKLISKKEDFGDDGAFA